MLTEKQIEEKLKELKADKRVGYADASIFTNAPLALIQLSIKSKIAALEWTLENKKHLIVG